MNDPFMWEPSLRGHVSPLLRPREPEKEDHAVGFRGTERDAKGRKREEREGRSRNKKIKKERSDKDGRMSKKEGREGGLRCQKEHERETFMKEFSLLHESIELRGSMA